MLGKAGCWVFTASGKWWKQWKSWLWSHPIKISMMPMLKSPSLMFGDWISCCLHWVCVPTYFNDLSGWWFRCRDIGEGINVLNPMPWTIRATSHLMPFEGHVASFQNAGYTQVHGPFFAGGVDGITLLPKVPKQYLMIIPISWTQVGDGEYYNCPLVTYPMISEKWAHNYPVSYQIPCFPREIPMVSLESPGKLQRL